MKKKIIVAAVAAAMVAPLAAMADATVYGKVRVGTVYHDRSAGAADSWELEDESSRLGIKGSEDLGGGLKAVYKMEFGASVGNGLGWSGRNAYVGLAGGWGTALWGRHDTPHKMSTGKLDLFGDTTADSDQGGTHIGFFHDIRAQDAIAYVSPTIAGGLTLAGAVVQTAATDDFANAYSIAGMYSNGPWYASLAYEQLDDDLLGSADDDTKWRVGLGVLGMSGFSATFVYEDRSDTLGVSGEDSQAWNLQGAYDFGNNRIKASYGAFDDDGVADGDFDAWAIGFQHNFSKRTDAQVIYRAKDHDVTGDDNTFAIQLNHSF